MRIPKEFQLFGQKITIEFDDKECTDKDIYGASKGIINSILLCDSLRNIKLPEDKVYGVFWHETLHAILDRCGYDKISEDEQFVDLVSGCIAQVLVSAKYKK